MYIFDDNEIKSFANGFIKAKDKIYEIKPDIIVAPMLGAVPFIDMLNAVDCNFDNSNVYYVPASGVLDNVKPIISGTIANILHEQAPLETILNEPFKVLSIDEVVGGGSATRVYEGIETGRRAHTNHVANQIIEKARSGDFNTDTYFGLTVNTNTAKEHLPILHRKIRRKLDDKFECKSIGIEHGKYAKADKQKGRSYNELVYAGKIIPIEVERILTMDDPSFCPVQYVQKAGSNTYYPTILPSFNITEAYLSLLSKVAAKAGNSADVSPKNLRRILDHQKYVPDEYHAKCTDQQANLKDF